MAEDSKKFTVTFFLIAALELISIHSFVYLITCVCLSLIFSGMRLGADSQFSDFLDGLGPAQLVGRQTLATPAMGK